MIFINSKKSNIGGLVFEEELIDNYVEKIRKIYNSKHFVPLMGEIVNDLRNLLGELIDNNFDYLLTDSFLDYVCCGANFFGPLHNLNDNDYTRISILKDYFESIFLNEKTHIIQEYYDLLEDTNFYLTEKQENNKFNFIKIDPKDMGAVYENLTKPYDELDKLKAKILFKE